MDYDMVNPAPVIGLIVYLLRQQQQQAVTSRVDRALDRLQMNEAHLAADQEIARSANNWQVKELVQMRRAMVLSMQGAHTTALEILRPLRVDTFPKAEQSRYFNVAMLSWLLLGRSDAARDIVETQMHLLRGMHVDSQMRTRHDLALAAFATTEGDFKKARPVLERIVGHRKPPLHRLLALHFLGVLENAEGRPLEAQRCFEQAAVLGPATFAARAGAGRGAI